MLSYTTFDKNSSCITARLDATRSVQSYSFYDGRGEVTQTFDNWTSLNAWSTQDIEYDVMGRAFRAGNPHYSSGYSPTNPINPTGFWATRTFDNLGRVKMVTMPTGDANPSSTTTVQTERDDTTGLDHTWWRKYDNLSGRWTSADPYRGSMSLADPQSFNRYAYVQNDPVNFVDPSGLLLEDPAGMSRPQPLPSGPGFMSPGIHTTTFSGWYQGIEGGRIYGTFIYTVVVGGVFGSTVGGDFGGNTGVHEFANSRVRCPPTGQRLAKNPAVKSAINEAFKRADQFRKERGYWVEHGGWIYQNRRNGRISTFIKTPDASPPLPRNYRYLDFGTGVYLHSPPTRPGSNIVGIFHIHTENGGPNEYDDAAADNSKAPGVLGTPDGRTYPYGNYQRGIFGEGTPDRCR